MELPSFLKEAPFHLNWDLETGTSKNFDSLKQKITDYLRFNPQLMTIQAHLFHCFIYISQYHSHRYNRLNLKEAKEHLKKAYDAINDVADPEKNLGYLTVAKCMEAYIAFRKGEHDNNLKKEIEKSISELTDSSSACIDSVRAFALSRMGIQKYKEAKGFFESALKVQPNNTEWLYNLGDLIGRLSRHYEGYKETEQKIQENEIYEEILSIDPEHALARVSLASNLILMDKEELAKTHAEQALQLQPDNPEILKEVGRVYRRIEDFEKALLILERGWATSQNNADLLHQTGLVYKDKYNCQNKIYKGKKKHKRQPSDKPDKELLNKAIDYLTKAYESNSTYTMALCNRARTYEQLQMKEEAKQDFECLLTVYNLTDNNRVTFTIYYAFFLERTSREEDKAIQQYCSAIKYAIENCTVVPVTYECPIPTLAHNVENLIAKAKGNFTSIMETKIASSLMKTRSEGFRGLAWLHHMFGDHQEARKNYEEYLELEYDEENGNDYDAIYHLTKSLIHLQDFTSARVRIKDLEELQQEDLALQCKILCALRQGDLALAKEDQQDAAKGFFREAIEAGSMEGCCKLTNILLQNQGDISTVKFRLDCARMLHCCRQNGKDEYHLRDKITTLMNLQDNIFGDLRDKHLSMELTILENDNGIHTENILKAAGHVLHAARTSLDHVMMRFQNKHYPARGDVRCQYFHVATEKSKAPKSEGAIKDEILRRLGNYQWHQFDTKFQDLLEFLVQVCHLCYTGCYHMENNLMDRPCFKQ